MMQISANARIHQFSDSSGVAVFVAHSGYSFTLGNDFASTLISLSQLSSFSDAQYQQIISEHLPLEHHSQFDNLMQNQRLIVRLKK